MEKVTQSNFHKKTFSLAANVSLLLTLNTVQCCKPSTCYSFGELALGHITQADKLYQMPGGTLQTDILNITISQDCRWNSISEK